MERSMVDDRQMRVESSDRIVSHVTDWRRALVVVLVGGTVGMLLAPGASAAPAQPAASFASLEVVRPVADCAALAHADLASTVGAAVTLTASLIDTAKGQFCQIKGTIALRQCCMKYGCEDQSAASWAGSNIFIPCQPAR
jgi:hypothetical protein